MPNNGKGADLAFISTQVVRWALKRSQVPTAFVADKLKVSPADIEDWARSEGSHPSFDKAEALAKILHVPFGFFFLSAPPTDDIPLPDFRGFSREYKPSDDLLELLNDILVKQDWYRDHLKESSGKPLGFVGSFNI